MTEPEALILSLPSPRKWITEVFTTSWPARLGQPSKSTPRPSLSFPLRLTGYTN
jgi:hypothetical protein